MVSRSSRPNSKRPLSQTNASSQAQPTTENKKPRKSVLPGNTPAARKSEKRESQEAVAPAKPGANKSKTLAASVSKSAQKRVPASGEKMKVKHQTGGEPASADGKSVAKKPTEKRENSREGGTHKTSGGVKKKSGRRADSRTEKKELSEADSDASTEAVDEEEPSATANAEKRRARGTDGSAAHKEADGAAEDEAAEDEREKAHREGAVTKDPYLLEERAREMENPTLKWTNKQRTLCFSTRGIHTAHRFLLKDIKNMLPHHVPESKWEKKAGFDDIPECAELNNCNNVIFLEARRNDLYMWMSRCPDGPTVKFQVFTIHTMDSFQYMGNCLKYSRPFLIFDASFSKHTHLKIMKELFVQMWGTPRNHPKSKPFHDHVMAFFFHDNKIWFRHYQIYSDKFDNKIDNQQLREIGPRFCMHPIRIFEKAFGGRTIWKDPTYATPTATRVASKRKLREKLMELNKND